MDMHKVIRKLISGAVVACIASMSITLNFEDTYLKNTQNNHLFEFGNDVWGQAIENSTKLLMHFDGTNASTVFIDEYGENVSVYGDAKISTEQSIFGGASGDFDGVEDYIIVPNSTDLDFGNGDFTIDSWIYLNDTTGENPIVSRENYSTEANDNWIFRAKGSKLEFITYDKQMNCKNAQGHTILSSNTWYHVAAIKSGTTLKLYINGILDGTGTINESLDNAGDLYVGASTLGESHYFSGFMDELHISKGTPNWTSDFTPPSQPYATETINTQAPATTVVVNDTSDKTSEISNSVQAATNDGYTKLLMHFDGTNGSTVFTDECGQAISANGNASISTAQSKFGGASGAFDGSYDYLSLANNNDFNIDNGDFTWDFWVRMSSLSTEQMWFRHYGNAADINFAEFDQVNGARFCIRRNNTSVFNLHQGSLSGWTVNTWYHIAIVKNGSTYSIYRNGILLASNTYTPVPTSISGTMYIGADYNGITSINGYMDELRFSKGIARWTSNFTPPSQPYLSGTEDTQPPTAPANLVMSSKTDTTVTLTWTASTDNVGVAGYDVYNGSTSVATTTGTACTVTNLIANTGYTFTVKARDAAGNTSAPSNSVQVTTNTTPTTSIIFSDYFEGTNGTPGNGWTDQSGGYGQIYNGVLVNKSTSSPEYAHITRAQPELPFTAKVTIDDCLSSSYIANRFEHGVFIKKRADNDNDGYGIIIGRTDNRYNNSSLSRYDNGVYIDSQNPVNQFQDGDELDIKFNTNGSIEIQHKRNSSLLQTLTFGSRTVNSNGTLFSLMPTKSQSSDNYGGFKDVEIINDNIDTQPPTAPANLTVSSKTDTAVTLAWTASTDNVGVVGYDIYSGSTLVLTIKDASCTIMGLEPNKSYTFTVKARDAAGNVSAASNPVQVTTDNSANATFNLCIKLQNIKSFTGRTFTVTYNPSDIESIVDLCAMTYLKETTTGAISGAGITITQITPGTIKFTVNKTIESDKTWSGIIDVITFKSAISQQVKFTCSMQ